MTGYRDFHLKLEPNRPIQISIHKDDIVKSMHFERDRKFRESQLIIATERWDFEEDKLIEREPRWTWSEMPRELASLCRILMDTQDAILELVRKMNGDEGDDKEWRCE